jgi:hypothetical protein
LNLRHSVPPPGCLFSRAAPGSTALEPIGPPVGMGDAPVVVVHAKLIPAGGAYLVGAPAAFAVGGLFEFGKLADGAGVAHGGKWGWIDQFDAGSGRFRRMSFPGWSRK